jgi:hypothetical protein
MAVRNSHARPARTITDRVVVEDVEWIRCKLMGRIKSYVGRYTIENEDLLDIKSPWMISHAYTPLHRGFTTARAAMRFIAEGKALPYNREPLDRPCSKCRVIRFEFCKSLATMSLGDPLSPGHYHSERYHSE